jgi:putative membrane protein
MILHVIGSHYTYSEVPFGFTLQEWLDANRNMYDRLVHFSFGLLLYYPLREMFARIAKVKGVWGYYVPLDVVAAFAGIFEIIEWMVARKVDPAAGLAFLGTQGDIWDAQKDMGLAIVGALIALVITVLVNWKYNHNFAQEIRKSLKLLPNDKPLGEEALRQMVNAKMKKSVQKIKDKKNKLSGKL